MKKKWLMSGLVSTLALPLVAADALGTVNSVWQKVLSVGTLNFIGVSGVAPVTRILLWILIFTLFFATITALSSGKAKPFNYFSRGQAGVIAGVIATISVIFIPVTILLSVGKGWATIISFFLIGGPVAGLGYLVLTIPGKGKETKGTVLIKLVLCLLLFWILSVMRNAAVLG